MWVEDLNRKQNLTAGNVLYQKTSNIYKDLSNGVSETIDTKLFTASEEWLHRFKNRFRPKYVKNTGEATSISCCYISGKIEEID